MKFVSLQMSKGSLAVFKEAQKVLIFIPEVKAVPMKEIIFKVAVIILIFGEYLKSKAISPSVLKRAEIEISLDINSVSVSNRQFESI